MYILAVNSRARDRKPEGVGGGERVRRLYCHPVVMGGGGGVWWRVSKPFYLKEKKKMETETTKK